jgi:hypothetical protein
MLGAAGHVIADAVFIQLGAQGVEKIFDVFEPLGALFIEQAGDFFILFGVLVAKAQIFELPFELPHAQAVGQRCENIERFFGQRAFFGAVGLGADKLHGAGAQRQLDEHHADVAHHRQQHFAHGFGLLGTLFGRGEAVDLGEMGELLHFIDAFDQRGDVGIARFGYFLLPIRAIAGNVGEQGGGHGIGQQIHIGHHFGSAQKVAQQGLAVGGERSGGVVCFGQRKRVLQQLGIGFGQLGKISVKPRPVVVQIGGDAAGRLSDAGHCDSRLG